MAVADRPVVRPRPVYLNLIAIRQPVPAIVSIMHRITGALLFLAGIPLLLWLIQRLLASPEAYEAASRTLAAPLGKVAVFGVVWGYLFHLLAGIRHLTLDLRAGLTLASARSSAAAVLVLSLLLAAVVAVRLW
ncbi:MAG: succinate dehydrogenase, cytochrome b556 subunit [Betaproteobacteria bacterium]